MRYLLAGMAVTAATLALGAAPAGAAKNVKFLQSPSENIGCVMVRGGDGRGGGEVRCDIAQHSWPTPPKPHSCHLDYGNGLYVGEHGKAHYVCAGDTVLHKGPHLAYGDAIQFAGFRCKSSTSGMRCVNRSTQHGFKLSREQAKRF